MTQTLNEMMQVAVCKR